jgi:hypothetical protein
MDAELHALAVEALVPAWAWRWAFIVGVGVLPFTLPRVFPARWREGLKAELQPLCAVVGFVLCLLSFGLAADTFLVEADSPLAVVETHCKVAEAPQSRWGRLQCDPGGFFFVEKPLAAPPGAMLKVTHLRASGLLIKADPIPAH